MSHEEYGRGNVRTLGDPVLVSHCTSQHGRWLSVLVTLPKELYPYEVHSSGSDSGSE